MAGIKNFVLGFIFSFSGVILLGHLHSFSYPKSTKPITSDIHITLFKKNDTVTHSLVTQKLFANVKKQSMPLDNIVADSTSLSMSNEGIEDDEILSIALDDDIPIEFGTSFDEDHQTEISTEDNEEKTAMLPSELLEDEITESTPWVVAKGSPYIKNKRLLSEIEQNKSNNLFTETIKNVSNEQPELSYKVAEKIKQSIIFPIPNEILNDENLTPTFIHTKKEAPVADNKKDETTKATQEPEKDLQIIVKETPKGVIEETNNTGILNNISSWFTNKKPAVVEEKPVIKPYTAPKKKKAPSYSSQSRIVSENPQQTENLAKFYNSLQQTREEHIQRNIASLELKLSFQPGRAEISGRTLQWLKLFSEAALRNNTYLQVRLDSSTDTELQKKRLNLLYTIFMNNGVDFKKIDTVFTLTEPNAFVIRTLKTK